MQEEPVDPSTFPLEEHYDNSKEYGPHGPLVSILPWRYPNMLANLRHIRLNLKLPPQHDVALWTDKLSKQLSSFVAALDGGRKLKSLKILVGTWHKLRQLEQPQLNALGILEKMQVRGTLQVRTMSLDHHGKAAVQGLDLERRMKANSSTATYIDSGDSNHSSGRHLDWEWEGGVDVRQPS